MRDKDRSANSLGLCHRLLQRQTHHLFERVFSRGWGLLLLRSIHYTPSPDPRPRHAVRNASEECLLYSNV